MSKPRSFFEIRESQTGRSLRLSLTGELDVATTPVLEDRLARLIATRSPVRLDLSRLDFIDSTGVHLLVRVIGDAHRKHRQLQIEPDLAPQVRHLITIMHLERIVGIGDTTA
jgi:anti-anti-sigma factor